MPTWDIVATFNITQTGTQNIISGITNAKLSAVSAIEVDGTTLSSTSKTYKFLTTGLHVVKYELSGTDNWNWLFANLLTLKSVVLNSRVTSIPVNAFKGCENLESLPLNDRITSIGAHAFSNCYNIPSVTIPSSVTTIGHDAFEELRLITSIIIPSTVTSIGGCVFSSCDNLISITVDDNNPVYDSRNNCNAIIDTATNKLISGCITTIIPDTVTSIGNGAFYHIDGLTSINIPDSVTSIGSEAFYSNLDLTSITIPSSVTEIGQSAFQHCWGLTSITVKATMPPTLEKTGSEITYVFDYTNNCPIYVPEESVNDYKTAWPTKYESRIQAMPIINPTIPIDPEISYNGITQDEYYKPFTQWTGGTIGYPAPSYSAVLINSSGIYWNNAYLPSTGAYISYTYQLLWNLDYAITHGGDANVQSDWNITDNTSYAYIKNKPTIPVVPTNISAFTNDAQYAYSSDIPTIPTNVSAFNNDAQYAYSSDIPTIPTNVSAFNNDAHYLTTADVSNKANASDAVGSLQLAFDTSNYTITLSGRRVDGTEFSVSDTVDLPLETMIVNGVYNTQSKSIIFTKQDGSTLTVNLSPLIDGLQEEITRNNKLDGSLIEDDSITLDQLAEDVTSELDKASTSIQGIKVNNVLITPDENNIVNIIVETPTPSGYFLTLNGVKKHLNIDYAFTDDDDYLNGLIDVAQTMVARHLDYSSVDALLEKYDNDIPSPIIHACYLLIGNYYMNRESVSPTNMTPIPQSYEYLLAMYKNRINYQG